MREVPRLTVHAQQPRARPFGDRFLGNEVGGEVVIKFGNSHPVFLAGPAEAWVGHPGAGGQEAKDTPPKMRGRSQPSHKRLAFIKREPQVRVKKPEPRRDTQRAVTTPNIPFRFPPTAEWLEADGLGGFASGTVSGIRTRRYHALLLTATTPPTGRYVLVNSTLAN